MNLELRQETVTPMTDFTVENHGSIYLVKAYTENALTHLQLHTADDAQWWGKSTLVVEPRYVANLVHHLREDGYTVD